MLSLSLFIQGSRWVLRLLFSIVGNVISVSKVTSLWNCSLRLFFSCHCLCLYLCLFNCICLCHCIFVGQVLSPHHSHHKSHGSQVSGITLWGCSLNVFVFVFVIVFFIVFLLVSHVSSSLWSNVSRFTSLWECSLWMSLTMVSHSLTQSVTRSPIELSGDS